MDGANNFKVTKINSQKVNSIKNAKIIVQSQVLESKHQQTKSELKVCYFKL